MAQTVLITGASRGIGRELARQYLERGDRVIACARDTSTIADLVAKGAEAITLEVTSEADISALRTRLAGRPVDILINNAGISGGKRQTLGDMDIAAWREVMEVNVYAPFRVSEALLDNVAAGSGRTIAIVSSRMGSMAHNVSANQIAYRTSKAAVNQVAKCLANGLAAQGIKVLPLHPGWVSTDMGGKSAPILPADSARDIIRLLDTATPDSSGRLWNHDGAELMW
ncbi:MAG: SDR family oxidoreductase [Pseudomonadota bacterium]|nr:SDR family oxidoreductase [Pseudomonadota bacterium]